MPLCTRMYKKWPLSIPDCNCPLYIIDFNDLTVMKVTDSQEVRNAANDMDVKFAACCNIFRGSEKNFIVAAGYCLEINMRQPGGLKCRDSTDGDER